MISRRNTIKLLALSGAGVLTTGFRLERILGNSMLTRKIPATGENIPVVGLGTWRAFDVGSSQKERDTLKKVLTIMKEKGGTLIDSSPMYGSAEEVVGDLTNELKIEDYFFYATKVWTSGKDDGIKQMNESFRKMKREKMDLMQIHNMVDWRTHIKTLRQWKDEGKIRYIGITHYTESGYDELESIMKNEKPDFAQFNYSVDKRESEKRLLPLAKELGIAVLINRPFGGGNLFSKVKGKSLPAWAKEFDIESWGQFFLKFILSNEAVNCVILGTSNPKHLADNMMAGYGKLPDEPTREKMAEFIR